MHPKCWKQAKFILDSMRGEKSIKKDIRQHRDLNPGSRKNQISQIRIQVQRLNHSAILSELIVKTRPTCSFNQTCAYQYFEVIFSVLFSVFYPSQWYFLNISPSSRCFPIRSNRYLSIKNVLSDSYIDPLFLFTNINLVQLCQNWLF